MFLRSFDIDTKTTVTDIVSMDYRTADVFQKYNISYCCGGNWPLETACQMRGVDTTQVIKDLEEVLRTVRISNQINFASWDVVFLMEYIVNVHHYYIKHILPGTQKLLKEFIAEHVTKYPELRELEKYFDSLVKRLQPSMQQEEEVIFPYIRQIAYAHKHKEPYGALFIRTLRKPVENIMFKGHETAIKLVQAIRNLTNNYQPPEKACSSHKVVFNKLKELDNDLMQHLFLEDSILFPQVEAIEKELLAA